MSNRAVLSIQIVETQYTYDSIGEIVDPGMTLASAIGFVSTVPTDSAASGRHSVWLSAADAVDGFAIALAAAPAALASGNDGTPKEAVALMQATPFSSNPGSMDAPPPYPTRERTPIHVLQARVRRYNPELAVDSDTYRAAVLMLAGLEYGQNLDLLARRTSFARAFVAKAARRLIDNGVWQGGRTVVEWSLAEEPSQAFWNDVAVAEGKLCRRMTEDGSIEWAPAGYWNKSYQYVDAGAAARLDTVYHDAGRRPTEPVPLADERVTDTAETGNAGPAPATGPVASNGAPPAANPQPADTAADADPATGSVNDGSSSNGAGAGANGQPGEEPPTLSEIFSDAVWIR
jgi:hypothetical protein